MTDPRTQARALRESVGVRMRDDLQVVRLEGDEQRSWLNGQVTNDVRHTSAGQSVYCLAVNVRGKIMSDLWVLDRGEALWLLVPRSAAQHVLESFESQIIMEDVEAIVEPSWRVISVQGPRAEAAYAAAGLPKDAAFEGDELGHGGRFVLVEAEEAAGWLERLRAAAEDFGGAAIDDAGHELARLRAGRPWLGRDFGEKNYPQEAGLKRRAVSFNKGCYLGQEVICTLENRGRLSKQLVRLDVRQGSVTPQDELTDGAGKTVGHVTSVVDDADRGHAIALGYVKSAHATPGATLAAKNAALSVVEAVEG